MATGFSPAQTISSSNNESPQTVNSSEQQQTSSGSATAQQPPMKQARSSEPEPVYALPVYHNISSDPPTVIEIRSESSRSPPISVQSSPMRSEPREPENESVRSAATMHFAVPTGGGSGGSSSSSSASNSGGTSSTSRNSIDEVMLRQLAELEARQRELELQHQMLQTATQQAALINQQMMSGQLNTPIVAVQAGNPFANVCVPCSVSMSPTVPMPQNVHPIFMPNITAPNTEWVDLLGLGQMPPQTMNGQPTQGVPNSGHADLDMLGTPRTIKSESQDAQSQKMTETLARAETMLNNIQSLQNQIQAQQKFIVTIILHLMQTQM